MRVTAPVASRSTISEASSPVLAEVWGEVIQRLCAGVAHSLKGALNGVSVNLEVVRSRAERPDTPASAVVTFATAASHQLDDVIAISEAMLALTRAPRQPVDLGGVIRHSATLVAASARSAGRTIDVDPDCQRLGATSADGASARLAIAGSLLAAADASAGVRCTCIPGDLAALRIACADGTPIAVGGEIVAVAAGAGIRITTEPGSVSIEFPR